jgi:two-component sensor histidine kinase
VGAIKAERADEEGAADEPLLMLVETIELLSLARSVEEVAAVVRSAARRISGADGVTFVLREGDHCHYLGEDAIGPLWKGRRFPMSACISGWAMNRGETVVIPDIYQDPRIPLEAYLPTFVKSLVMTPVRPPDPIAAIGAYWARERVPTRAETAKLAAIARATATALENVSLIASLEDSLSRSDALVRELDHRVKNNLAVVQAIAQQTIRTTHSAEAFNDAFLGRLTALSRGYDLLAQEARREARLQDVLEHAIAPHAAAADGRLSVQGPEVRLSAETAINFQMAFHELASNAVRHGALATAGGRVSVRWEIEARGGEDRLALTWLERGGPAVTPHPSRKGFGLRLIGDGLPRSLGGKAELAFEPEGLRFSVEAPLSASIMAP